MTYGDVANALGVASPRLVGHVLARRGGTVPWQRVVRSDGSVAPHLVSRQVALLRAEGTPLRGDRVNLRAARWTPVAG